MYLNRLVKLLNTSFSSGARTPLVTPISRVIPSQAPVWALQESLLRYLYPSSFVWLLAPNLYLSPPLSTLSAKLSHARAFEHVQRNSLSSLHFSRIVHNWAGKNVGIGVDVHTGNQQVQMVQAAHEEPIKLDCLFTN